MTTTKAVYIIAAIVPFGFVALACAGIVHVAIGGLRDRRLRRSASTAALLAGNAVVSIKSPISI